MNGYGYHYQTQTRMAKHNRRMFKFSKVFITIMSAFVIVIGLGSMVFMATSAQSPESITCTVSSKERVSEVVDGNSTTRLLINTEDCGTLEIGSALFSGNWSLNSTYSTLQEGETYTFEVYGYNLDMLNQFKQIKSVETAR